MGRRREPFTIVHPNTRDLPRPAWLALRRQGIGTSDAAPAMGMSPWRSSYDLFCEKAGLVPEAEAVEEERYLWGLLLEPVIIAEAVRRGWVTGPVKRHLMLRSIEHPHLQCNPDALGRREVVEVKCASSWDEPRWDAGVPDHYVIQAVTTMIVTGRRRVVFPVLFGGNNLREFVVDFDPDLAATIIEATALFWQRVRDGEAPDPDHSESTMHALRERYLATLEPGKAIELPAEAGALLDVRELAATQAKKAEELVDGVKARLMEWLGQQDAEVGLLNGEQVCTWRVNKAGNRVFRFAERKGE